jgi:hypothetical protein
MNRGFIYVANQEKFKVEAILSAKSLRKFTNLPISVIITENLVDASLEIFDKVIVNNDLKKYSYLSKILGMKQTPYEETIFLDSDTYICGYIDNLFDLLKYFDFSSTIESKRHTTSRVNLLLKDILPEFNTGVIIYKNSDIMKKIFGDWFNKCLEWKIPNDMPGFREAVLNNFDEVKYSIIPNEFNLHGLKTMTIIEGEVKIIHERLGYDVTSLTPYLQKPEIMEKLAKRLNRVTHKRLYLKYIGVISYRYTPFNILHKLKKSLGAKKYSKSTYFKS